MINRKYHARRSDILWPWMRVQVHHAMVRSADSGDCCGNLGEICLLTEIYDTTETIYWYGNYYNISSAIKMELIGWIR